MAESAARAGYDLRFLMTDLSTLALMPGAWFVAASGFPLGAGLMALTCLFGALVLFVFCLDGFARDREWIRNSPENIQRAYPVGATLATSSYDQLLRRCVLLTITGTVTGLIAVGAI